VCQLVHLLADYLTVSHDDDDVSQSVSQSVCQSIFQLVSQSVGLSVSQSVCLRSVRLSGSQSAV